MSTEDERKAAAPSFWHQLDRFLARLRPYRQPSDFSRKGATAPIRSRMCMLGRAMQSARLPSLKVSLRSISTLLMPWRASTSAAVIPIGPAPTIATG